jgi:hypothetical protein
MSESVTPYLVGGTALVGAKHDDVRGAVGELLGVEGLVVLEELHVGSTALETVWGAVSHLPELNGSSAGTHSEA